MKTLICVFALFGLAAASSKFGCDADESGAAAGTDNIADCILENCDRELLRCQASHDCLDAIHNSIRCSNILPRPLAQPICFYPEQTQRNELYQCMFEQYRCVPIVPLHPTAPCVPLSEQKIAPNFEWSHLKGSWTAELSWAQRALLVQNSQCMRLSFADWTDTTVKGLGSWIQPNSLAQLVNISTTNNMVRTPEKGVFENHGIDIGFWFHEEYRVLYDSTGTDEEVLFFYVCGHTVISPYTTAFIMAKQPLSDKMSETLKQVATDNQIPWNWMLPNWKFPTLFCPVYEASVPQLDDSTDSTDSGPKPSGVIDPAFLEQVLELARKIAADE